MLDFTRVVKFSRNFRYFCVAVLKSNFHQGPWNILYFGTDQFAVRSLDSLNSLKVNSSLINNIEVICPAEKRRAKDIKQNKNISTVRQFAEINGLPIHNWPVDKKNVDFLSRFHLGIVVSFGHFIPSWIIRNLLCGAINVHPSLLPKWRGPSPIVNTLLNGDTETGVSIIEVSLKKFDAGNILLQKKIQIPPNTTYEGLSEELSILSSNMLLDVLTNFTELKTLAIAQDEKMVTEALKVSKEMGYVKWSEFTCEYIERLSRVIGHRFGLKCKWNDQVVKLETFGEGSTLPPGASDSAEYGQPFYNSCKNVLYIKCKFLRTVEGQRNIR
ncbi:methionyl-tRNA formyltransferase, mitochondrial-like [Paramuricea clavata]|uniref:Methionyl-tRNA formyltransferase, mitochondrial-like n=1 Tax=Paramuricea clavata TaxID=317549 RepID=A0A7D9DTH8_PARCT|nr:methionyl-tRNA formyltransferase, mitochondrial-like [Paramuricea clavata]